MTGLRETMLLKDARAISLMRQLLKDDTQTFILKVRCPLTPELADTLHCRNQTFNLNDNPWPNLESFSLDHKISNCELTIPTHTSLMPKLVTGFKITPSEAADADGALELHFRMKFSDGLVELNELLNAVKSNTFDMALGSTQGELFDVKGAAAAGDKADDTDEGDDDTERGQVVEMGARGGGGAPVAEGPESGTLASARQMR